jgi:hypothetical protein
MPPTAPASTATPHTGRPPRATSPMPRTSILDFEARARQRLANLATEARLHATGDEAAKIDCVCAAAREGQIATADAHAALAGLRQQQRRAA